MGMISLTVLVIIWSVEGKLGGLVRNAFIAVVLAAGIMVVMPERTWHRMESIWTPQASSGAAEESKQGRVLGWEAAMEVLNRFPILGVGPDNFSQYRKREIDDSGLQPHNGLAQGLADTGLLGVSVLLLSVVVTWSNGRKIALLARGTSDVPLHSCPILDWPAGNL